MTDCIDAEVRDALPDLMHGRLSELNTATMKAHVEACADCREELRLLEEVRASAPITPRIDVARIVAALPAAMPTVTDQLIAAAPARGRRSSSTLWKMTAVAALLITGSLTFATGRRQATVAPVFPASTAAPVASVPVSSAAESLIAVASNSALEGNLTAGKAAAGLSLTGGVQDLSDEQLEALVNGLDNVEAIPSAEPEPFIISVDEDRVQ